MDARQDRGRQIDSLLRITKRDDGFVVPSPSGNGRYRVR